MNSDPNLTKRDLILEIERMEFEIAELRSQRKRIIESQESAFSRLFKKIFTKPFIDRLPKHNNPVSKAELLLAMVSTDFLDLPWCKETIAERAEAKDSEFFCNLGNVLKRSEANFDKVEFQLVVGWTQSFFRLNRSECLPDFCYCSNKALTDFMNHMGSQETEGSLKKKRQRLGLVPGRIRFKKFVSLPDGRIGFERGQ